MSYFYFWLCWVFIAVHGLSLVSGSCGYFLLWFSSFSWCGPWALGAVVAGHETCCPVACGIFPDQASNPCPLPWQANSQPLDYKGGPCVWVFEHCFTFWYYRILHAHLVFCSCFIFAAAKSLQPCLTLWDPIDGSPPGSSVSGILQARTLQWVAISFSNAWKWKAKVKSLSRARLLATPWTAAHQAPLSMGFSKAKVLEWSAIAFSCLLLTNTEL